MFTNKDTTLCTTHSTIIYWAKEIKRDLKKYAKEHPEVAEILDGSSNKLGDIIAEARAAKRKGQHMENRLRKYRNAVESLGFVRKRGVK